MDAATREALEAAGLTVGEPLAHGRRGRPAVHRGLDREDRHVAVRLVDLPEGPAGAVLLRRLAALKGLRHEGIARVREVIAVPGGRAAVTVDLVAGADLAVVLGARCGLTRSEAARLLDDLGSALAHLHAAGLVHGDVAPGNVVVTTQGGAVLVDVVSGVMETGTAGCAAPEVEAGSPPTAASDVYGLARLLELCAEGSASLRERLEPILADALSEDSAERPTARALAARAPGIARPGAVELPDGARLAAGALRAAAHAPTRQVPSRRDRRRGAAGRRPWAPVPKGWRRRPGQRVLAGAVAAALLLGAGAVLTDRVPGLDRAVSGLAELWEGGGAATPEPGATDAPRSAGARGTAAPSPAAAPTAATVDPTGASQPEPTSTTPGTSERDAVLRGTDPLEAAVVLAAVRDEALAGGDAAALASTTVADGPAAQADAELLTSLKETDEEVRGLSTALTGARAVAAPDTALGDWPEAVAVAVTLSQSASTRTSRSGEVRTVPEQPARDVVLVLVPAPWRVAEVLPAP